jgi:hypothetical protein
MVAEQQVNSQVVERVGRVYQWLDEQLRRAGDPAAACDGCGKCCDFDTFDHRLFVTPPELIYNIVVKCSVYDYRFAGCRIFCCKTVPSEAEADSKDFQSRLSESALKEFKSICAEFDIPYRYTDLAAALNSFSQA